MSSREIYCRTVRRNTRVRYRKAGLVCIGTREQLHYADQVAQFCKVVAESADVW